MGMGIKRMSIKNDINTFIDNYLNYDPQCKKTFTELSVDSENNIPLVNNNLQVLNMDYISDKLYNTNLSHCSADSLYITNKINVIEFKRNIFGQSKKQKNKRIDIHRKMYSTLLLLEKIILPNAIQNYSVGDIQLDFIIVVDSNTNPNLAMAAAMRSIASNSITESDIYFNHFKNVFFTFNGVSTRIFYDNVEIWNDINFNTNINFC